VSSKDYYQILGVERDATFQQVKEAYRKRAFEWHPDRNKGDPRSVEKMKELNEAYAVLSDPEKRGNYNRLKQEYGSYAYDRFRQRYTEQDIYSGSDIGQIFEEMARNFGFRNFDDLFQDSNGQRYRTFEFKQPGVFGRGFIFLGFPRRGQYGQTGAAQSGIFSGLLGRLAGSLLQNMLGARREAEPVDRHGVIAIAPEDAQRGGKVSYVNPETSRQFIVTIPTGVKDGQTIRLKGAFQENGFGAKQGDLYLKIQFREGFYEKVKAFYRKLTG
jgi:DnaJ-class molecular chaperone